MKTPPSTQTSAWITVTLPDDEITVLLRLEHDAEPIALGYHEDNHWCHVASGDPVEQPVLGWMHLEDAARKLDAPSEPSAPAPVPSACQIHAGVPAAKSQFPGERDSVLEIIILVGPTRTGGKTTLGHLLVDARRDAILLDVGAHGTPNPLVSATDLKANHIRRVVLCCERDSHAHEWIRRFSWSYARRSVHSWNLHAITSAKPNKKKS